MKEEYYRPREIRYTKPQIKWLILNVFGSDVWPSDGKETGYTGGKGKLINSHAPYETVKVITGELSARLNKCGLDGLLLCYLIKTSEGDNVYVEQEIADFLKENPDDIRFRLKTVLNYCRGRRRKLMGYGRYLDEARWREKRVSTPTHKG